MQSFRSYRFISFVSIVASFLWMFMCISNAYAQSEEERGRVTINSHQFREEEEGVYLEVLFSLVDGNNEVVTSGNLNGLFRELSDNGTTPAQFVGSQVEETEIFVVLALDMSGSMKNDVLAMKEAALNAVTNAPANTQFAIFQFSDTVIESGFMTPERAAAYISANINGVQDAGTKLFDGVYEAIQAVNAQADDASMQKAVIVFSDGHDEEVAGTGIRYSTHSLDQVMAEAADSQPLPIHTIGFRANFSDALAEMAQETSGRFVEAIDESELDDAFAEIMNGLSQQWLATTVIFPEETGRQQIELEVEYDGVKLDDDFFITVTRIVPPLGSEADIQIREMQYIAETQQYRTQLDIGQPKRINEISLSFKQGGNVVTKKQLGSPFKRLDERMIDTAELGLGEYVVEVSAVNIDGDQVRTLEERNMILQPYDLEHKPDIIIPQPEIVLDGQNVQITLRAKENKIIDRFRIQITDSNNEQWFDETIDFVKTDTITVTPKSAEEEKHVITVHALDTNGDSLTAPIEEEFTYVPPARPGFFKRIFNGLAQQPLFAFFLIFALLILIVWLVLRHLQNRSATGIPIIAPGGRSEQAVQSPMRPTHLDSSLYPDNLPEQNYTGARRSHHTSSTHFDMDDPDAAHSVQRYVVVSPATIDSTPFSEPDIETGRGIQIERFPLIIGRGGNNDELNALLVSHKKVSRQQAEVQFDRSTFTITAINERNAVIVDGTPLTHNSPVTLEKGMPHRIRLTQDVELTLYGHESH